MKISRIENMCGGKGHVIIKEILEEKRRTDAGVTAPPQGLVLVEICYGK